MPSTATATVFALAFAIWLALPEQRRYATLMLLGAAAMAFGRIYVGVHYPLDIIGGIIVGLIAAAIMQFLAPLFQPLTNGISRMAGWLRLA